MDKFKTFVTYISAIPQIVFTWGTFFACGILIFILMVAKGVKLFTLKNLIEACMPYNLMSLSFFGDVHIYITRKIVDGLLLAPGAAILAALATASRDAFTNHLWIGRDFIISEQASIVICGVVLLLFVEFSYYLWHYMEHKIPFLWEIHKVHHSAEFLNPLTNLRAHPIQVSSRYILSGVICAIPAGFFMFYFGFSFAEILVIIALSGKLITILTLDPLRHSHVHLGFGPLDAIIVSPHMHQVHHSAEQVHWDKNFGTNLSIFDWIFGTGYRPKRGEKLTSGIHGYSPDALNEYNSFKGAYITPVRKSFHCLIETAKRFMPRSSKATARVRPCREKGFPNGSGF